MNSEKAAARTLRLSGEDNVVVAADRIEAGTNVVAGVETRQRIPFGHKIAARPIAEGEAVVKFGQIIGFASKPIAPGDWVHEHNVVMHDFERDYQIAQAARPENILPIEEQATFQGYRRANGRAGTRNYIGILTSVNCSASVARFMAEAATRSGNLDLFGTYDGVGSLTHGTGCGRAGTGEGSE
ncbi:UxaA family hydrolase, partial [Rhizobiaceae sp. 2RAB30]